jgi:hypothetical protein
MINRSLSQNGSTHIVITVILIVTILAALVFVFISKNESKNTNDSPQTNDVQGLVWRQDEDGWKSVQTPPACDDQPLLSAPTDISKATSVLYPGQTRGQYKPHGGLRFDNAVDNNVIVEAPFDGYIVKATRNFAEGTTEVQYGFDIMNNCGIMTRFGHFNEIPANLQAIANKLPEPSADSRIENVNPAVKINKGDIIATKVGLISERNTFFDWGVYDYRQQNEASKSSEYQTAHPQKEFAWYGVCWLTDWLPAKDTAILASLPAGGGENGKASDYCK